MLMDARPIRPAAHVMDTFTLVRDSDVKEHAEYRTKRLILERFDAISKAIESGESYLTALDPPPADPRVAHRPAVSAG